MKRIILLSTLALLAFTTSCKKETKQPAPAAQTPTTPTVTTATMNMAFFVDADQYEIREPFVYPGGSAKLTQTFTALGVQNVCSAASTKLNVKYYTTNNTDTTFCTYWFYKNNAYVGTCDIRVLKTGQATLTYASPVTTYLKDTTCIKAVVFN